MRYTIDFEETPNLTEEENAAGRDSIDEFNEMFNVTCDIIATFKGDAGLKTIDTVVSMVKETPELQQFLFEFYYNTHAADRVRKIYNEK